jgi:hypothetical protein
MQANTETRSSVNVQHYFPPDASVYMVKLSGTVTSLFSLY